MPEAKDTLPYRVLARKYRPVDFTTLVGQEAMVRTPVSYTHLTLPTNREV